MTGAWSWWWWWGGAANVTPVYVVPLACAYRTTFDLAAAYDPTLNFRAGWEG